MKYRIVLVTVIAALASSWAGAQQPAETEGIEPEEPTLILPDVVIQVTDMQTEEVVGGLPEEEGLSAKESEIPLPEADLVLAIEPVLALPIVSRAEREEADVHADVEIGAGSVGYLSSDVALYKIGKMPRFQVNLMHRQFESFELPPLDVPYSFREENFKLDVGLDSFGYEADFFGDYREQERGLQGQGSYSSRTLRSISGDLILERSWKELFRLSMAVGGGYASSLLNGAAPLQDGELVIQPRIAGELEFGGLKLGLAGEYGFSALHLYTPGGTASHRLRTGLYLRWDLPISLSVYVNVAYYLNSSYIKGDYFGLLPFDLGLSGNIGRIWDIRLDGGFRVEPQYDADLLFSSPYSYLTEAPGDDTGWFADTTSVLHLGGSWVIRGGLSFRNRSRLLVSSPVGDPGSGLYAFDGIGVAQLRLNGGFQWNHEDRLQLSGRWAGDLLPAAPGLPTDELELEASLTGKNRQGKLQMSFKWGNLFSGGPVLPILNVSASIGRSSPISFTVAAADVLNFLGSQPRFVRDPFVEPGCVVTAALEIEL